MMEFGNHRKGHSENKGRFIVIDGIDGSGKATQIELLREMLRKEGYEVETADFPQYGKKSAGPVEEYLNGKYGAVDPYVCSLLYAVDRFDAGFEIRKWLDEGKIVLSNRYVTANAGHQGSKIDGSADRIKYFKWLDNLEYGIFGIPKPDLNIVLDLPAEVAQKLVKKKSKEKRTYVGGKKLDLHEKDLPHLRRSRIVFLQIAKLFPNTKLVECIDEKGKLLPPEQIHNKIWNLVRRIALK